MAYAESLVDGRTVISVKTAAHLASCSACKADVESMCGSIKLAREAGSIECSRRSTAQILLAAQIRRAAQIPLASRIRLAAKNERRGMAGLVRRHRYRVFAAKGLAYAVCLVVLVSAPYGALQWNVYQDGGKSEASRPLSAGVFSLDALRKASPEEELLSAAVMAPRHQPETPWEHERRRAVLMLDDDISEALEALARNPSCVRASELVSANRRRLKETLKALYVERSL